MKRYERSYVSLTKIAGFPLQDTAVGFYRIIQPLRFMKREKIVKEARTLPFTGENQTEYYNWSDKTYMEICEGAQVLHTTLLWKQSDIIKCLNLRKHYNLKWVVDLDDNIWASPKDNAATDSAEVLRKNRELCLSLADGITVSVPTLKELVERINPQVYVQYNALDFTIWDKIKVPRKRGLRIGWRGALGHKEDLELIRPIIESIKEAYPNCTFVTFGYKPEFSDEHHSWTSFQKYPDKLASLAIDIAVVPLVDSAYNRCKSNLNWMEWAALKVPIVYSPTENNKNMPGFAATTSWEWFNFLEKLIVSPTLRKQTGELENVHVKKNGNMKQHIWGLASWMDLLPRRTDLEP